ncbi:MAG: hypothetical protein OQK35_03650 [Alphaproteobacteria bacterium]|nr:hypothetical protein [Rhodospirillales bacterium]MCW9045407.1 hypothetical protein [Alphaproteobacteria bacterium]
MISVDDELPLVNDDSDTLKTLPDIRDLMCCCRLKISVPNILP